MTTSGPPTASPASMRSTQLVPNFRAVQYLDLFLVSAVAAVLGIRFFLYLTDYPTVGGDALHIAHMLWGGLLMLLALIVVFFYFGKRAHRIAALLGGLGFGTFIDEVGKFLTLDNDYFFRPAVAIIYVVFVLTYLGARGLHRPDRWSRRDYLVNALEEVAEFAVDDLDEEERRRALAYLERSDPLHPLVGPLRTALIAAPLVPAPDPHPLVRFRDGAWTLYQRLAGHPLFPRAVILFFVAQLVFKLAQVAVLVVTDGFAREPSRLEELTFVDWAQVGSSLLAGILVFCGVVAIRYSRLAALRWFQRSVLVSVFLTQTFMFYEHQFSALTGLAFNLVLLAALNFVLDHETARRGETPAGGGLRVAAG